jgi:glycosyltransferase involved in cell wall biosynthesis
VYSDATKARVRRDLGVPVRKMARVNVPVATTLIDRVRSRRPTVAPSNTLLYVGLDRPQKNLDRALLAWARSEFGRQGGTFTLVGLGPDGSKRLRALATANRVGDGLQLVPQCSDDELAEHYASARLVIQPSLEEGFGLPVVEALASGVPTCCSDEPALREAAAGFAQLFDPWSVEQMAAAIDRTAATPVDDGTAYRSTVHLTTAMEFAESVIEQLRSGRLR